MIGERACLALAAALLAGTAAGGDPPAAAGEIRGLFVFDGEVPEARPAVPAGGAAGVCGVAAVPDETLIVDPETKGIRNVFVWAAKVDGGPVPPVPPAAPAVEIDNWNCRFEPHCLVAQSGQQLVMLNADAVAHNVHTNPIRGNPINVLVGANDRVGLRQPLRRSELLPIPVICDIHPWMKAQLLVLDHPYAALSDEKGEFVIRGLPPGEYDLKVWHEAGGYVLGAGGVRGVAVSAAETTDLGATEFDIARFKNLRR